MAAICLTSIITMAFIFIGQVNVLAPIVSINFMLTYSFIDYSYFSVAMTYRLQTKEKADALILAGRNQRRPTRQSSRPLIEVTHQNYGSRDETLQGKGTLLEFNKDMDQIFPPVSNGDAGTERECPVDEPSSRSKSRKAKATGKQMLMNSFGVDLNSNVFRDDGGEEMGSAPPQEEPGVQCDGEQLGPGDEPQVKCRTKLSHGEQDPPAGPHHHSSGD